MTGKSASVLSASTRPITPSIPFISDEGLGRVISDEGLGRARPPPMQTSSLPLQFHPTRRVGGQQRCVLSRALALENGENRRQDYQRGDGPSRQAADHC